MFDHDDGALAAVIAWFIAEGRDLPWRAHRDVYAIWVSEVMSAQTSVLRAAAAWERWMARWPTVEALAAATLAEVLGEWQGLGYPRRARDLHRSAVIVAAQGWPDDLQSLPGIGPYIAAAVACFARGEPVLPLDVNVRRVLARRFPAGVDVTRDPWRTGQALMEFGQRICTARPRCRQCPVFEGCGGAAAAAAGREQAPRRRPQKRYEGSDRQRRGELLRRVLTDGAVSVDAAGFDPAIAGGLIADGLLGQDGDRLVPPR